MIPFTPIRKRFLELKTLDTASILDHARSASASELADRFAASVEAFAPWCCSQPFFESARKPLPALDSLPALRRTEQFDAALKAAGGGSVVDRPELSFRYLEREIVPARTTTGEAYSNGLRAREFVRFDLLLAGDLPILA